MSESIHLTAIWVKLIDLVYYTLLEGDVGCTDFGFISMFKIYTFISDRETSELTFVR